MSRSIADSKNAEVNATNQSNINLKKNNKKHDILSSRDFTENFEWMHIQKAGS